jgi:hypothetical protein
MERSNHPLKAAFMRIRAQLRRVLDQRERRQRADGEASQFSVGSP